MAYLRALAVSIGRETRFSEVGTGGMKNLSRPILGRRVPWGAQKDMGVNVDEAVARSTAFGMRFVEFCEEVRHELRTRYGRNDARVSLRSNEGDE